MEVDIGLLAIIEKEKPMLKIPKHMPTSDWEYWDEEIDAWNRLHFVAATCTSRDRSKRLTATQVVREWNKSSFERETGNHEKLFMVAPATDGVLESKMDLEAALGDLPLPTDKQEAAVVDAPATNRVLESKMDLEAALDDLPVSSSSALQNGFVKSHPKSVSAVATSCLVFVILIATLNVGSSSSDLVQLAANATDSPTSSSISPAPTVSPSPTVPPGAPKSPPDAPDAPDAPETPNPIPTLPPT